MRLEMSDKMFTHVVLSRRNVLALLHKVDWEESARTITQVTADARVLLVSVEPDAEHYAHADRKVPGLAGKMHEATEEFIENHVSECGATDPLGHCVLPFGHPGECFMDGEINA